MFKNFSPQKTKLGLEELEQHEKHLKELRVLSGIIRQELSLIKRGERRHYNEATYLKLLRQIQVCINDIYSVLDARRTR
jgi:hypothetical protein